LIKEYEEKLEEKYGENDGEKFKEKFEKKHGEKFEEKLASVEKEECKVYQDKVEYNNNEGGCDLIGKINPKLVSHIFGLSLSAAEQEFKWLEDETFESKSDSKTSYSIDASYGFISDSFNRYNIGYRFEDRWQGSAVQNICLPNESIEGAVNCQSSPVGEPKDIKSQIGYLEWKSYLGKNDQFAISTLISRDFEKNRTGIKIPVYLYSVMESNDLQGGVSIGWNDEDDNTQFSLFFSKPFSITE
ncbi:hypothetical protein, partial [Photobacterium minamisatsumaniensis]|uniref:hypothetical protein n=1 Tax=Photobacterium minamisatsumaniensis TaxID=2910233 RepID=UPI003D0A37EF